MSTMSCRPATIQDLPALLELQSAYYAEERYPFRHSEATDAWTTLLSDANLGHAWLIETESACVGYVVVTFGFSLEYGGRDAAVDELYLAPARRGHGLGAQALSTVAEACDAAGVRALHLEVESHKARARDLYRRFGFSDQGRVVMTRRVRAM